MKFIPRYTLLLLLTWLMPGCVRIKRVTSVEMSAVKTVADSESGEQYKDHVRTTEFRSPNAERLGFKLPPGFEITLFAAEPDISKPLNMAFDEKGRLWVTHTAAYPLPEAPGKGSDRITILEDTNGDGRADRFTDFADDLNIPIGIVPVKGGAVAFSIPSVYRFTDQNGDGKADKREVLLGKFGYQDTHGMVNSLTRGFDGWIHAGHGFTNTSTIAGTDGDSITMVSGNTFRFRLDGSRAEQTTTGRVNPFGFAHDEWGYLYSTDSHSLPIYQLIRGGDYPHFGKKERGIGFAPVMMDYAYNSTALPGLAYYTDDQFPPEFRNNFYSGDVVTCRISRSSMTFLGSTPKATRQADFLVSEDPWFRPVDIKIGPDGAMYVADFYNRIIGHYEVPLTHPDRDRRSGRIWRITYRGNDPKQPAYAPKDWSKAALADLVAGLGHERLNIRLLTADQLVDRFGKAAIGPVTESVKNRKTDPRQLAHGIWVLHRLNALPDERLTAAARHRDARVRVHAYRVLAEYPSLSDAQRTGAIGALTDPDPHVRRVAAEALGRHPARASLDPLFALLGNVPTVDTHLRYTVLLAIRNHLQQDELMERVMARNWTTTELALLADLVTDVPTASAGAFLFQHLKTPGLPDERIVAFLPHVARYVPEAKMDSVVQFIRERFAPNRDQQYALVNTIRQGIERRGGKPTPRMEQWAVELAGHFLKDLPKAAESWKNVPVEETGRSANPWVVTDQPAANGFPATRMLSSGPRGAGLTGRLISPEFVLPDFLKLYVRDNDSYAGQEKGDPSRNAVRVRLADSGRLIGEKRGTAGNMIFTAEFDLSAFQGRKGYLEVLDSLKTDRQSSLSVGLFEPAVLRVPDHGPADVADRQVFAAEVAGTYRVTALEPDLQKILESDWADHRARTAAADALMILSPERYAALLGKVLNDETGSAVLREKLATALGQSVSPAALSVLERGMKGAPSGLQTTIATVLANTQAGITALINAIRGGYASARILLERAVEERLRANSQPRQRADYEELTVNLPPISDERNRLVESRFASFDPRMASVGKGSQVFVSNCSACHQVKNQGGLIGPQLDGIGNWGRRALTEKILDPNRNVSEAFRSDNLTLKNGKAVSGLYRREEGELLVFANAAGGEFSVPKRDIQRKTASRYTLMPDQFEKTIPKEDFDTLLVYLLSLK